MPKQPKSRRAGRPALPKHEAKGKIVPVRFKDEEWKRIEAAAVAAKQTVSHWIRSTLEAALGG